MTNHLENFSLEGKVAIVTGGNGGIGKRIARGFAGMGADIVIAARNQEKTASAVREIKEAFGVQVLGIQTYQHGGGDRRVGIGIAGGDTVSLVKGQFQDTGRDLGADLHLGLGFHFPGRTDKLD